MAAVPEDELDDVDLAPEDAVEAELLDDESEGAALAVSDPVEAPFDPEAAAVLPDESVDEPVDSDFLEPVRESLR